MADNDLDAMLEGSDQNPASQAQMMGQEDDINSGQEPLMQQTPEEIEFNKLSGSTQDRIKALARRARQAEEKLNQYNSFQPQSSYQAPSPVPASPDIDMAVRQLSQVGIATDEKVNRTIDERLNVLRWEQEQARLESKFDGSRGEPQYVREEVEDFIRSHPQYQGYAAEDVFRHKMFPDEFLNLELQTRGSKTGKTSTLKPTSRASTESQGMTPEFIAERTDSSRHPDAVQWQEEHRQEIDKVLSQMQ